MNIQETRIVSLFTGCFQWSIIDEPLTGTENLFFVQYIKAIVSKDVSSFSKKTMSIKSHCLEKDLCRYWLSTSVYLKVFEGEYRKTMKDLLY